jgi:hypothetical protein
MNGRRSAHISSWRRRGERLAVWVAPLHQLDLWTGDGSKAKAVDAAEKYRAVRSSRVCVPFMPSLNNEPASF